MIYEFTDNAKFWDYEMENCMANILHEKLEKGEKLTKEESASLQDLICNYNHKICTGTYKLHGWCFDFRPFLKRYWVKTRGWGIEEYWGLNKTFIKEMVGRYYALEIIEVGK